MPLGEQLPAAEAITWPEPEIYNLAPRLNAMLKPDWFHYARRVRHFLRGNAHRFDLAHQIMPQGLRYATPLHGMGLPYVVGPLGGALTTPPAFASEITGQSWFTKLRALDHVRLRHDPWLRRSYADAALVLGVAPYVREALASVPIRRYENVLELGIDGPAPDRRPPNDGRIRLLHVGRGVRTKGLRDVIRAMGLLKDRTDLYLTSAGTGEEIEVCRREAAELGILDRISFRGLIPRAEVEELYATADIFVFPSFREPAGNVIYEAMRWGLPVIAAARGGPDHIVDDSCGMKIRVTEPKQYARDVAQAITALADDPALRRRLGEGARAKVLAEGLW